MNARRVAAAFLDEKGTANFREKQKEIFPYGERNSLLSDQARE
jgi:hypothetical protein